MQRSDSRAERVAILGAGRMGADIAITFARGGWRCDVVETDRRRAAEAQKYWTRECRRLRIPRTAIHLSAANDCVAWRSVDLLIEAVTEDLALKHRLLRELEPRLRKDAFVARNASGLRIADATIAELARHFTPRQITDIAMSAAYYRAFGAMAAAFGAEIESAHVLQRERDWQKGRQ